MTEQKNGGKNFKTKKNVLCVFLLSRGVSQFDASFPPKSFQGKLRN
jgi:hypothetical protein